MDFDSLTAAGSMMGSGGMIVMDERTCMVDVARYFTKFLTEESCGKCVPCREGLRQLLEILTRITEGAGEMEDLERVARLSRTIEWGSLCALGRTAANPVISTLKFFRNEYETHIQEGKCPAGVCASLSRFTITDECTGCTACVRACPTECITGEKKEVHVIDQAACIQCGACYDVCRFDAVRIG